MKGFVKRNKDVIAHIAIIFIIILTAVSLFWLLFGSYKNYIIIEEKEIYIEVEDSNLQVKKIEYSLYDEDEDIIYIVYSDKKLSYKIQEGTCTIDISNYKIIKTIKNVTEKGKKVNE